MYLSLFTPIHSNTALLLYLPIQRGGAYVDCSLQRM